MSPKKVPVLACTLAVMLAAVSNLHAASKVGKYAYVPENGQLVAYATDPSTGRLRVIQAVGNTDYGAGAIMHPSNKFVYVPTAGSAAAAPLYGFKIGSNGTLTSLPGFPISVSASWVTFTPNGKFAYMLDPFVNSVGEYSVDTTTGALTSTGSAATGNGPNLMAITSKGTFAYVTNEFDNTVSAFSINSSTGALTPIAGSPFESGNRGPDFDVISPNGKFLLVYAYDGSTAVFTINTTTGVLKAVAGSPFAGPGGGGLAAVDMSGPFSFYYAATVSSAGIAAYLINPTTGALTEIPGSPFPAGAAPYGVTVDPSGKYLYVSNAGTNQSPVSVFSIDLDTGALTQALSEGLVGQNGGRLSFSSSTNAIKYTPTFAYVTNSGGNSITELSIADGGLSNLTGSPITDTNGPQASVATQAGNFLYTGNSDGSISEYSIGKTGALKKLTGSPITGLSDPVALVYSPFYNWLYAIDPVASESFVYTVNAKTGALSSFSSGGTGGTQPEGAAVDPFGKFALVVNEGSDQVEVSIPFVGLIGPVSAGAAPVAITIDPSNQFVYVANSGGGTVSGYSLTLASPYLTPLSGSPYTAGTTPSALVTDPFGQYLYVANAGSDSISAYSIDPLTGVLSPISGTFSTSGSPSALAVSNDGKILYATDKDIGELDQFTINSDGTLTAAGGAGVGTAPTSITTIGTYK
ncbi:MAG: beta-propeller fold lactonase family protein [Terriglobales bacterium]|jgi:6-phosphogluconolactonase (cycloisomerase 2 family)